MLARVKVKRLDQDGVRDVIVSEEVTLPLLTEKKSFANTKAVFPKGATFTGERVVARIKAVTSEKELQAGEVIGIAKETEKGIYLLPEGKYELLPEKEVEVPIKKEVDSDIIEEKVAGFDPEEVLGFSWKQLVVIGGITAVVGLLVS
jgi:hypothetical protein